MRRILQLPRKRLPAESGLTLIELVIASGLSLLVLTVIGGIMVSGFTAQGNVTTTNEATSYAQVTARQVETGIRQASVVRVFDGDTSGSQVLVARTEVGTGELPVWECQVWFYDDTADAIFHSSYEGDNVWPWGSDITNWIDLGSGITEVIDVGGVLGDTLDWLFGGDDDGQSEWSLVAAGIRNETGPSGAEAPVFEQSASQGATITFAFDAGDLPPVLITTTATGRQAFSDSSPTCF